MSERELDPRGFVVPQVGDVVKVPSKWPGEWDVAQVDFVQFVSSRQAYEVDLLPLKSVGQSMYRLPGRKPAAVRADVAKLSRLAATYVRGSDAFLINEEDLRPLGGTKESDPDLVEKGLEEYRELKATLLREAALVGLAAALSTYPVLGADVSGSIAAGTAAGCMYVWLLSREADGLSSQEPRSRAEALAVAGRLGVPVLLLAALAARNRIVTPETTATLSLVSPQQFAGAVGGFLSYKVPLLTRQVRKAFEELSKEDAQAPIGMGGGLPTGSLGVALKVAKQSQAAKESAASAAEGAASAAPRQIVVCGPSGVGKSSLVAKLLEELPGRLGFAVSCTTRPPREGEVDGEDYAFIAEADFEKMVARGDFIENARVGSYLYGTSVQAIEKVSASGKACILDIDVQGVQALRARSELAPLCIWIAPPSLAALRTRLQGRGTEDASEVERRLKRARDEIEFALSARCFEQSVVNDDLDKAYAELKGIVLKALGEA